MLPPVCCAVSQLLCEVLVVCWCLQVEFTDADADARQEFESAREEVRNRNSEEYNVLKIQLEGIIEELERHFEQVGRHTCTAVRHALMQFEFFRFCCHPTLNLFYVRAASGSN